MPLVRGEVDRLHEEIFAEVTYHAAYQPQRAVRTDRYKYIRRFDDYPHPVLANCDDSASKDLLVAAGWGEQERARRAALRPGLDPAEGAQHGRRQAAPRSLAEMRERLEAVDARDRRSAARGPGRAASGGDRQRAVGDLAGRPAAAVTVRIPRPLHPASADPARDLRVEHV